MKNSERNLDVIVQMDYKNMKNMIRDYLLKYHRKYCDHSELLIIFADLTIKLFECPSMSSNSLE